MLADTRHYHLDHDEHQRSTTSDRKPKPEFNSSSNAMDNNQHESNLKSSFLGFEMDTELVWEDWDLSRAVTKTFIIRNTLPKLQRILFRPPLSKYFSSLARQKLVLGPGQAFSIPITFKPCKMCDYADTIEFQGRDDSFQVLLRASARCPVEVPETVLFPPCAVQHFTEKTFTMKNISELSTFFLWKPESPFSLSPEQGHVKPGKQQNITVNFHPQEAGVFQKLVSCRFGTQSDELEGCCHVLLQGQAKHPYLEFKSSTEIKGRDLVPVLDFGSAATGQTLRRSFEIFNPSVVPVFFTLSRLPSSVPLLGSVFEYDVTEAEVGPGKSVKAKARFTPTTTDTTSVEYLSLSYRGGISTSLLKLIGSCGGPQLSLSSSVVDFGKVEPGQAVARTVELVNTSKEGAVYQWDIDCNSHSVFSIQPAGGTVLPQSRVALTVSYRASQPLVHYRRAACLVQHREPLFLDLVGNCHSEKLIRQLHLGGHNSESDQESDKAVTPMAEDSLPYLGVMDYLFSSPHQICIRPKEFIFNKHLYSLPEDLTSYKPMTVTNYSKEKLRLEWTVPPDSSFSVSPSFCEVPSQATTSFRVIYRPKQLNTLHGEQLECFVYPMDNDDMNDSVLPSCLTVRAIGHSLEPGQQFGAPQCSFQPHLVDFTPVKTASYRTAHLKNNGDLPLTFHLDRDHNMALAEAASLVVVPSCGLIEPHSHQILSLQSVPTEDSPREGFHLKLYLNASKHAEHLTVISRSEQPLVSLKDDGRLRFQPTAVNSLTQGLHQIRNHGRQALGFQWRIPVQEQGLISVEPDVGVLHPNESLAQTWSFTPLEEKSYTLMPSLTLYPVEFPEHDDVCLTLEVTGTGCTGFLEVQEAVLQVPDILVGECRTITIPVVNSSPCPLSFCVTVEQKVQNQESNCDANIDPCALSVQHDGSTIASKSTIVLESRITPPQKAQYTWTIRYQTINANGSLSAAKVLCEVCAKGVFPTLQVIDVCGRGSLSYLSKKHLWRLLSLNKLNKRFLSSPGPAELTDATATRHSLCPTPTVFTNAVIDFHFSGAPLHSEPSSVMLMLHNPDTIPVEWAFLFPEDQLLDLESWAESGQFTSAELSQRKVQDNHLFSVEPRAGKLTGGQQTAVTFTYRHDCAGRDRFPVLLKIFYGTEIMLTFHGETVEVDRPLLNFASKTLTFASVAIGEYNPPKQVYHFYNQGAVPVHYEVDKAALSQIQEENFNHPVLRCLNPDGEVLPREAAILEWIFSPLEAKLYQIDIPVHVLESESILLRFEGCGLLSKTQPLSESKAVKPFFCDQRLPFQPIYLSEDRVDFGDIVVSAQQSKMLNLVNSSTDAVHFEWVLPQPNNKSQVMHIIPSKGRIAPGEKTLLIFTLSAGDYPTIYRHDLVCKVTSEAALAKYHTAVQKKEKANESPRHECILSDKAPKHTKVALTEKEAELVALRQEPFWNKYKILPPIRSTKDRNTAEHLTNPLSKAERRALRELEQTKGQSDPEPPAPSLLHLWVTAQSYGSLKLLTDFPKRFNYQYRDVLEDSSVVEHLLTLGSTPFIPNLSKIPTSGKVESVCPKLGALAKEVVFGAQQSLVMEVMRGEMDAGI